MQRTYFSVNRKRLYQRMNAGSPIAIFSKKALWTTDSVYLTGLKYKSAVVRGAA